MMEMNGKFYLGRLLDLLPAETSCQPWLYEPTNPATQATVIDLIGSGKNSSSSDLLEEASLNNHPALMHDLKGHTINAQLPQEFRFKINPNQARQAGIVQKSLALMPYHWVKTGEQLVELGRVTIG